MPTYRTITTAPIAALPEAVLLIPTPASRRTPDVTAAGPSSSYPQHARPTLLRQHSINNLAVARPRH